MTTSTQHAARRLLGAETSHHLIALEQALDSAVGHTGRLLSTLADGRTPANLGLNIGADAMAELTQAVAELGATRRRIAGAHAQLAAIARKFGLDETQMIGGGDKDPSAIPAQTVSQAIRRVV